MSADTQEKDERVTLMAHLAMLLSALPTSTLMEIHAIAAYELAKHIDSGDPMNEVAKRFADERAA